MRLCCRCLGPAVVGHLAADLLRPRELGGEALASSRGRLGGGLLGLKVADRPAHAEVDCEQAWVDLLEPGVCARRLGDLLDVALVGLVGPVEGDLRKRIAGQRRGERLDRADVRGGQEPQPGVPEFGDGAERPHRSVEDDGGLAEPVHLPDLLEQSAHGGPVLGLATDDRPAQGISLVRDQQYDRDAPLVGHLGLGPGLLGHGAAHPLEPGVGDVHEQRAEAALPPVLVPLSQSRLQRRRDAVESLQGTVDPGVVEGSGLEAEDLGQSGAGHPASRQELGARHAAALQDQR